MNLRVRHYFVTGLLVWLPMGITVWVLTWLVTLLDNIFLSVLGALDAVIPGIHVSAESLRNVPGLGVILVAVVISPLACLWPTCSASGGCANGAN